jgi:CheY-like chemotaxis protein
MNGEESPKSQPQLWEEEPTETLRILYAEDDPDARLCVAEYLAHLGYKVTPVGNGCKAWEALRQHHYDLLITDYQMPGLSGAELALRVRLTGRVIPIIVTSGHLEYFTKSRCRILRIGPLLQKPFSPKELGRAIHSVLDSRQTSGRDSNCQAIPVESREEQVEEVPIKVRRKTFGPALRSRSCAAIEG